MTTTNWLSPVQILDSHILGVNFSIESDFLPDKPHYLLASLDMKSNIKNLESVEDMFICKCILECIGNWTCDKKESTESIFSASCKLSIVVAIPKTAFATIEKEEKDYFIAANAVSIAYGKIRAVIENITAESIVGKQTILTINPYTFSISAKNAAKN